MAHASVYLKAVEISEEYLGPTAERFLRRQIDTHLGITPENLKPIHMPILAQWTELAFALLTKDSQEVNDYTKNLLSLGVKKTSANEKTQ